MATMLDSPESPVLEAPRLPNELPASALRRICNPVELGFRTTDELPDLQDVIGQPRALRALELGSQVSGPGYNVFVLGVPGSGRTTLTQEYLRRKATDEPIPSDWCYVNNFDDPHKPKALQLPAGRGVELRKDIQELIAYCRAEIPRVFQSDEYIRERDRLVNELAKKQEAEFIHLQQFAEKYKFVVVRTPYGIVLAPAPEGKPLTPEELQAFSPEQRAKLEELQLKLGEEVEKSINRVREVTQATSEMVTELSRRAITYLIGPNLQAYSTRYADLPRVLEHLEAVKADILDNANDFRPVAHSDQSDSAEPTGIADSRAPATERAWRYAVNVLVDNSGLKGAPVILESQPSYQNLLGRIEHIMVMGATRTDFTMIQAGALHRANGGYLILSARDLLINPYAWEGVKRVLRDGAIRILELSNLLGILSTESLEPEPIPLDVKVILVGTPLLYYLLRMYDEDFGKLFKVRAEFGTIMERNTQTEQEYGLFVKSVVEDNHLPPFDNQAVARIIEYSSRLAEHQDKLSTRFGKIADLIRESAYWAAYDGKNHRQEARNADQPRQPVTGEAVERAIEEAIYRSNLLEERIQELIADGTLMIDVTDHVVGQVNALSVLTLGDHSFGKPSRVTASVFPGRGGVIDIERQAKLGGPIHTKGVMIISGFLGAQYGQRSPLSLSASLTFEQTYDEIEGDSASAAELFALLSAIANVPLRQDRAVTGSVNQLGKIQAIGGVNEKVEGFFTTCKLKGLTGEQGVILPASNVRHLMLREDVIEAVKEGKFHLWPIETVAQGIQCLTGLEMGEQQADQTYPEACFNYKVIQRLNEFHRLIERSSRDGRNLSPADNPVDEY